MGTAASGAGAAATGVTARMVAATTHLPGSRVSSDT